MKKNLITIVLMLIMLCITTTYVFADNTPISLEGAETVTPGQEGSVTIKVSSSDAIGVVSGYIKYDSNIASIEVSGKNNWSVTYNSETGKFNVYKAEGATSEEIIEIKYTASNEESTGTITLSELQVTTINYETQDVSDITKSISIKNETIDDPVDDPTQDNPTEEPTENPSEQPAGNNNIKNDVTTNSSAPTTSTSTTATKTLPYAGVMTKVVLPIGTVLAVIAAVVVYLGYRKYKGI